MGIASLKLVCIRSITIPNPNTFLFIPDLGKYKEINRVEESMQNDLICDDIGNYNSNHPILLRCAPLPKLHC